MGVRTAHQVDPKAQLVISTSHSAQDTGYTSGEDSAALDSMSLGSQAESNELKGLTTDSDVLSAPRMVEGSGGAAERPLGGLEQAVLLGFAQQVKKGTSADELQVWDAHKGLGYSIHVFINDNGVSMHVGIWRFLFFKALIIMADLCSLSCLAEGVGFLPSCSPFQRL